jgi:hypothetical protein
MLAGVLLAEDSFCLTAMGRLMGFGVRAKVGGAFGAVPPRRCATKLLERRRKEGESLLAAATSSS